MIRQKLIAFKNWCKRQWKIITVIIIGGAIIVYAIDSPPREIPYVIVDEQVIEFSHIDENSNENLIIRTDKQSYSNLLSWSYVDVYVMVENKSGIGQSFNLQSYFPKDGFSIQEVEILVPNVSYEVEVIDYATSSYNCTSTGGVCIREEETGRHKDQRVGNQWQGIELKEFSAQENEAYLNKGSLTEKDKKGQKVKKKVQAYLSKNAISYFKIKVGLPKRFSKEEFFIEAVGSEGAYGLLDPTILTDDFNAYNDGDLVGQGNWTKQYGSANMFLVQSTTTYEGSKAVWRVSNTENRIEATGTAQTDGSITTYMMFDADDEYSVFQLMSGTTDYMKVRFYLAKVQYYSSASAWTTILDPFLVDTWYYLKIEWRGSDDKCRYSIVKDGNAHATATSWVGCAAGRDPALVDKIRLDWRVPGYIDYIAEDFFPAPSVEAIRSQAWVLE